MKTLIPVLAFFTLIFISCSKSESDKAHPLVNNQKPTSLSKNPTTSEFTSSANYYFDKYIDVAPDFPNGKLPNIPDATCDAYAPTLSITYLGFSNVGNPGGNGARDITINWMVGYPSAPDNGDPGISPVLNANSQVSLTYLYWLTGMPLTLTAPITFLGDEVFDEDYICHIPPYRDLGYLYKTFSATFTLSEPDYCFTTWFQFSFTLSTNCSTFPFITPANPVFEPLPQLAYTVVPFTAFNSSSGGVHKFTAFGQIGPTPACHGPSLGLSPLHTFKWGPFGTTARSHPDLWNSITRPPSVLSTPFDVIVPAAGLYDYKSKGILYQNGQESRYTVTQTVNVL
jgi:hypothetical protein